MKHRHLINLDGSQFEPNELEKFNETYTNASDEERIAYRNENAQNIAANGARQLLIVSGPGTGKSTLFKQRIVNWQNADPTAKILALSFVRKLVADLNNDIQTDAGLTQDQKNQTEVYTLHKYSRSIVERNHGSKEFPLQPHFKIIGPSWKDIVWMDVLHISGMDEATHHQKKFDRQLHDNIFDRTDDWPKTKEAYFRLCQFYNAVGFADLIIRAINAVNENPGLVSQEYFIIDEYQDFNTAEENLINALTHKCKGLLIVGDDDQVLYDTLKSGKASLIRNRYRDPSFVNAMLPFCGRCSYHIVKAAGHFIKQDPEDGSIEKAYLPLKNDKNAPKVRIIGCATSTGAVSYIARFIKDEREALEKRRKELENNVENDAYVLILTPAGELKFYNSNGAKEELLKLVEQYKVEERSFSNDYFKVLTYYSLGKYPRDNFSFRKILHYENIDQKIVFELIDQCLAEEKWFNEIDNEVIKGVLEKCGKVKEITDSDDSLKDRINQLAKLIQFDDPAKLFAEIEERGLGDAASAVVEHREEEEAELEELEVKKMSAIELMTIVGSKGLSADHVIIIGFDNVNMSYVSRNAFYVAMTRARKSLHIITALGSGGSKQAHQFLNDLPVENVQFYKYQKTGSQLTPLREKSQFVDYLLLLNKVRKRK